MSGETIYSVLGMTKINEFYCPKASFGKFYPIYISIPRFGGTYYDHYSRGYHLLWIWKLRNRAIYMVLDGCKVPDDVIRYILWDYISLEFKCPKLKYIDK